jgi:hypothetical protein
VFQAKATMSENSAPFLKTTVKHVATAACKRSATFGHILLAAFLIVGVIAVYIEVRLRFASIRHTDSLDSSGNGFHDFIEFESALPSERDIVSLKLVLLYQGSNRTTQVQTWLCISFSFSIG